MSSPPFGKLVYGDDDLSYPIEAPDNPIEDQITQDEFPTSSLPILEYQDLSMFLDDDDDDNEEQPLLYSCINNDDDDDDEPQSVTNTDCMAQTEQVNHQPSVVQDSIVWQHTATTTTRMLDEQMAAGNVVGEGSSSNKKLDHNAKERVRRMKLNATFLALRSLLPDSRRPKKRWSAPYVIDRALEYIPQLQSEIEKLTLEKDNMASVIEKKQQVPIVEVTSCSAADDQRLFHQDAHSKTLTVSVNEVREGEIIVQICEHKDKADVLTTLFEKLEGEGILVEGASSLCASEDRSCFHIHIQTSEKPRESDYVANLHKKIISWLS